MKKYPNKQSTNVPRILRQVAQYSSQNHHHWNALQNIYNKITDDQIDDMEREAAGKAKAPAGESPVQAGGRDM